MEKDNVQNQIADIQRKLDYIIEEIEYQKRHRSEMEDLEDDLVRVAKDVYDTAVVELEEVHDSIKTGDILHLFKKLLRNINNLTSSFEKLENLKDFIQDFSPVSREMFLDFMHKMNEFDKKGYFEFARELNRIADNIVTSFSPDDVKNLGDNIVAILKTVKNITQPDMLQALNNALSVYKNMDVNVKDDVSFFYLLKEMNNPDVKRGLAFAIEFLKNISNKKELL